VTSLLPGFRPSWTVPAGIDELGADMERNGLKAADFEGPRFVRLERINQLRSQGLLDDLLFMKP